MTHSTPWGRPGSSATVSKVGHFGFKCLFNRTFVSMVFFFKLKNMRYLYFMELDNLDFQLCSVVSLH